MTGMLPPLGPAIADPNRRYPRPARHPLGSYGLNDGQRVELPMSYVRRPTCASRFWDDCVLEWYAEDDTNPTRGPTLTKTGTPQLVNTAWHDKAGASLQAREYAGAEYYRSATSIDPPEGYDVVVIVVGRRSPSDNVGVAFATRAGARGIQINTNGSLLYGIVQGDSSEVQTVTLPNSTHFIALLRAKAGGDMHLFFNHSKTGGTASPAGSWGDDEGVCIGAPANGGSSATRWRGDVRAIVMFTGSGLADLWTDAYCLQQIHELSGIAPELGDVAATFSRASAATDLVDHGGTDHLHVYSADLPRAGTSRKCLGETQRVNKVGNNVNPQATTGWAKEGDAAAVLSVVDDSTELAAGTVDLRESGPNVIKLDNSAGVAAAWLRTDGAAFVTGNTNAHSLSAFCRWTGSVGDIGLWDDSGTSFTKADDALDGYARTVVKNVTPGDTDERLCFEVPAGAVLFVSLGQLEEGAYATTPIPNWATDAAATRLQDVWTPDLTPRDAEGRVKLKVTPQWDGADAGQVLDIIGRSGGATAYIFYYENSPDRWKTYDGTTAPEITDTAVSNTEYEVDVSWGPRGQRLTVDGGTPVTATEAYDGTRPDSDTYEWAGADCRFGDVEVYELQTGAP